MRLSRFRYWFAFAALMQPLLAQTPAVLSVTNSLSGESRLAPGLTATIRYTPFDPKDSAQGSAFNPQWPFPAVYIGIGSYVSYPTGVQAVSDAVGEAVFLIPREVPVGPSAISIHTSRGTSAAFPVNIEAYSPALRPLWSYCNGAKQVAGFNAEGLGATNPPSPTYTNPAPGQAFPTAVLPTVTVAGFSAVVLNSAGTPPYAGYYGSFEVPAEAPEGIQPVVLSIGGVSAKSVDLLVGTQQALLGKLGISSLPDLIQAAPESIVDALSCSIRLATGDSQANPKNPPATLGATQVRVRDSAGVERLAPMLSASAGELKYVVPAGTATGRASVAITVNGQVVSTSPLDISDIQPALFGTPYLVRIRNGMAKVEPVDVQLWRWTIDLGPATDQVYLVIAATGLRNRSSSQNVALRFAGYSGLADLPAAYAGPQGEYAGVDQINIPLRRFPPGQAPEDGVGAQLVVGEKLYNWIYLVFHQTD